MDVRDSALRRFAARADDPELAVHHAEATAMVGSEDELGELYDRLTELLTARPNAILLTSTYGDPAETYHALLDVLPR